MNSQEDTDKPPVKCHFTSTQLAMNLKTDKTQCQWGSRDLEAAFSASLQGTQALPGGEKFDSSW